MEDMVILDVMNDVFYPKEDILNIFVDITIQSVSGRGCQEGGYLKDIERS